MTTRCSRAERSLMIVSGVRFCAGNWEVWTASCPPPAIGRTSSAAGARPPGTSCQHEMLALEFERLSSEIEAGAQVIPFQVGELRQQVFERVAARQIFEYGLDGITQMPNGGLAMADSWINRDAGEQVVRWQDLGPLGARFLAVLHAANLGVRRTSGKEVCFSSPSKAPGYKLQLDS